MTTDRRKMATPAELSDYLAVPVRTLAQWRWQRQGPPYVKAGHHVRYPWPGVDKWVAERTTAAA